MSKVKSQKLILLGAVFALGFAFFQQYVNGLHPCELCIWQRWGYAAVIFFCLLSVIPAQAGIQLNGWILACAGMPISLALGVEVAIAVYHTGIEYKWWEGFQSCSSGLKSGLSIEELRRQIMAAPRTRCDEPVWFFFGLSMAAWNAVYAFGLFIISLIPSSCGSTAGSGMVSSSRDPRVKPEDDRR